MKKMLLITIYPRHWHGNLALFLIILIPILTILKVDIIYLHFIDENPRLGGWEFIQASKGKARLQQSYLFYATRPSWTRLPFMFLSVVSWAFCFYHATVTREGSDSNLRLQLSLEAKDCSNDLPNHFSFLRFTSMCLTASRTSLLQCPTVTSNSTYPALISHLLYPLPISTAPLAVLIFLMGDMYLVAQVKRFLTFPSSSTFTFNWKLNPIDSNF